MQFTCRQALQVGVKRCRCSVVVEAQDERRGYSALQLYVFGAAHQLGRSPPL